MATLVSWTGAADFADVSVCESDSFAGLDRVFDAADREGVSGIDEVRGAFTLLRADGELCILARGDHGIYSD